MRGTHSCTCMCAGHVLQDAVLESRVGTWQVSDRRVTTEGRPALNSAWAARELLEALAVSCSSLGQGHRAGAYSAGLGRPGGAESALLQKGTWARARHGTGWYGGVFACFHRTCGSKRLSLDSVSGPLCLVFSQPLHVGGRRRSSPIPRSLSLRLDTSGCGSPGDDIIAVLVIPAKTIAATTVNWALL